MKKLAEFNRSPERRKQSSDTIIAYNQSAEGRAKSRENMSALNDNGGREATIARNKSAQGRAWSKNIGEAERERRRSAAAARNKTPEARERSKRHAIELRKRGCNETGIERTVKAVLIGAGLEFKQEFTLGVVGLADFYLPAYNLVIECDGEYWHASAKAKQRDAVKNAYCKRNGIGMLRLSERDIRAGKAQKIISRRLKLS